MGTEADEAKAREDQQRTRDEPITANRVTLDRIGNRMAAILFDRELQAVIENMLDVNTDPRAKREIVLKFVFKPSEKRTSAAVLIASTSKLCPVNPQDATIHVGRMRRGGKLVAVEDNPRQRGLWPASDGETPVDPVDVGNQE